MFNSSGTLVFRGLVALVVLQVVIGLSQHQWHSFFLHFFCNACGPVVDVLEISFRWVHRCISSVVNGVMWSSVSFFLFR